jgi:two-component response regulator (ARR-B family)
VQGLTRENVASHLQKYRLYLKRLQSVQADDVTAAARGAAAAAAAAAAGAAAVPPPPAALLGGGASGSAYTGPLPPPMAGAAAAMVTPSYTVLAPQPPPGLNVGAAGGAYAPAASSFDVHLPGTAPGGGYPAHLLPLGGLNNNEDALGLVFAPAAPLGALASDIQAVSQLDMGIHGLSMDGLGGDELMELGTAPVSGRLHGSGGGLSSGNMVASESSDALLKLFLKDALPETDDVDACLL